MKSEVRKLTDQLIMAALGFVGALLVVLKPILNLNTNITELKMSIDAFKETVSKLDDRITKHGEEIDDMKETLVNHEVRISNLEK